jgi:polysaccharide biosynthesis transport protein
VLRRNGDLDLAAESRGNTPFRGGVPHVVANPHRLSQIDLAFVAGAVRRQVRLIGLVLVTGLAATLFVLLMMTPRYTATASILIDIGQRKGAAAAVSDANSDVIIQDEVEILRSRRIAARVLKQLEIADPQSSTVGSRTSWWWPSFLTSRPKAVRLADASLGENRQQATDAAPLPANTVVSVAALDRLMKSADIERKGRSYIVDVTYSDSNGDRAAAVSNAFIDAYLTDQLEVKSLTARGENQRLKTRIQVVRKDIEEIEHRQQAYRVAQGIVEVGSLTLMQKEISDYAQQLTSARARAAEAEARLTQAQSLAQNPQQLLSLDVALQSSVIREYRRQAAEIQRRIGENLSRYGDQHTSVISAKAELDNLNVEIQNEMGRIVDSLKLAHDAATGKVKLLEDGLQTLKEKALAFEDHQRKLAGFTRDLDVSTKLYSELLQRYHETGSENLLTSDARVLSYAVPPSRPTSPKKTLLLMLASVAWLGGGVGFGLMRELSHRPLRSRVQTERALGLPCISELPVIDPGLDAGEALNLCTPIHWKLPEEEDGRYSQAIFALRQWTESISARPPRVVLVTATHRGEGCSTIAAQLARYAMRTGLRTVLVDADLRSRGLTDALGIDAPTSFADCVLGQADPDRSITKLPDGLDFCPAPRGDCPPLDVLGSRRMLAYLNGLRDDYELIVVDTAPLAPYVDATALIEYADGVLLVVKAEQTEQQDVIDALNSLDADPQVPIAVVLNMFGQTSKR